MGKGERLRESHAEERHALSRSRGARTSELSIGQDDLTFVVEALEPKILAKAEGQEAGRCQGRFFFDSFAAALPVKKFKRKRSAESVAPP